jgi:arylsulfatase
MGTSRRDFIKLCGASAVTATLLGERDVLSQGAEAATAARPTGTAVIPTATPTVKPTPQAGPEPPPEDPLVQKTVQIAENMEPVIPHPEQDAEAQRKLAALKKKFGKKPNILIFIMDNIGFGDPGIYGGGLLVGAPTPNMDRLGRAGLQLLSTYSQPSCTPSRTTLLTGRLPIRHGQLRPVLPGESGGLGDEISVAQILSKAGYVTQMVGKWHCGENKESQPQNVGFDDFYGFLGWSGLYTDWRDPETLPEWALSPARQALAQSLPFNRNVVHGTKGKDLENLDEITMEVSSQLEDKFAAYSTEFIKKMAKSDKPFFLYHGTRGGHFKNYPNPKFKGRSPARYPYKDMIIEVDDILGRLVKALDETGQLENTLIFVTSDNGPHIEVWPDSAYSPFRGGIGGTWEGSVRVPGIVYWKGTISPGRVSDGLFDLADLFNTSIALAGVKYQPSKDRYIDGIDQTSFLLADNGQSNRKAIYYWLGDLFAGVRVAEYKIVLYGMSENDADVMSPGSGTTLQSYINGKAYNLYLDPKEQHSFINRQTFLDAIFAAAFQAHRATFKKYPPKVPIQG